jgi:hypothetical protein
MELVTIEMFPYLFMDIQILFLVREITQPLTSFFDIHENLKNQPTFKGLSVLIKVRTEYAKKNSCLQIEPRWS